MQTFVVNYQLFSGGQSFLPEDNDELFLCPLMPIIRLQLLLLQSIVPVIIVYTESLQMQVPSVVEERVGNNNHYIYSN